MMSTSPSSVEYPNEEVPISPRTAAKYDGDDSVPREDDDAAISSPEKQAALSTLSTAELTSDDKEESEKSFDKEEDETKDRCSLFYHMTVVPWPYLVFWPAVFACLIGFGWTQDDIVEDEVTKLWIPTSGQYAQNVEYAKMYGKNKLGATSFAAMSIARDGGNLFQETRLEEIRARMEKMEKLTVRYKALV